MTVWIDSTEINSLLLIFYLIYSWVVDLLVVERLLSIWNDIKKLIKFLENLPKFKRPSCKSYNHLTNTASDILMPAKLQFFCFIAGITKYQSDKANDAISLLRHSEIEQELNAAYCKS